MKDPSTFAEAAHNHLTNKQMRQNVGHAMATIQLRREIATAELPDWELLRDRGQQIKTDAIVNLADNLELLERSVTAAGGLIHWARTAEEANSIVTSIIKSEGGQDVVKVKSMTTEEIGLNDALAAEGIAAHETDLAELIVQLAGDQSSHLLVPAIHLNRTEIRDIFREHLPGNDDLSDTPEDLAEAARKYLRSRFLSAEIAVSGANFAVAETGTVCVVESEGNGRMCTTLPRVLITIMGIEKVLPRFEDLAVMLQLLPRSSTGERMNPYTSLWTGVREGDGPKVFHLVLLDAGRSLTIADPVGRQALHCIRCSACVNVCPVYEQTGGHAYNSAYAGPIGAILTPQLSGMTEGTSLPGASTLCGACYDACPVKINIPSVLIHLRSRIISERAAGGATNGEQIAMRGLSRILASPFRYEAAQRAFYLGTWPLSKDGLIERGLPGPMRAWTTSRDLISPASQSFRSWWRDREAQR